jgi:hypothetical protein
LNGLPNNPLRRIKDILRLKPAAAVIETLASLNVYYPQLDEAKRKELAWARQALFEEQ